ncbi:MAG: ABC transporter permease [Deltaproteobacteria bacterium]|nr:MAG: ABC transporter permease [Deltaproteobacteria bacterium]
MFDRRLVQCFDWGLLGITCLLAAAGLATLYSATTAGAMTVQKTLYLKQLTWYGAGLVVMTVCFIFHYKLLDRYGLLLYLAAIALARYRIRFRTSLQVYLLLPFTIPLVVSGLGMMILFGELRILGQLWPVGLALCVINLPFMIWAVSATVNALDPDLENAAANCGAPPLQAFLTVTLPAVMPGVITGALLMFILAFNEFLVSLFLTDARIVTLPVSIYNSIRSVITPDLAAVSVVYIVIALFAVWLLDRLVGLELFLKSK